jgi:hypothetical protein
MGKKIFAVLVMFLSALDIFGEESQVLRELKTNNYSMNNIEAKALVLLGNNSSQYAFDIVGEKGQYKHTYGMCAIYIAYHNKFEEFLLWLMLSFCFLCFILLSISFFIIFTAISDAFFYT